MVKKSFTIRDLPVSERPRERLQKLGVEKPLSVTEILVVILGRGIAGESVAVTVQRLAPKPEAGESRVASVHSMRGTPSLF